MPARDDPDDVLPKLTVGQRILASLPSLQRGPTSAGPPSGRAGPGGKGGAVRPDAVIDAGPARRSLLGGGGANGKAAPAGRKPNPFSELSVGELREAMKRLDDRERLIPMFVGPLVAALDLVLTSVALHNNPALGHKGHTSPSTILAVGIGSAVLAGLVVLAAFIRRRSFTIFALLFSGYGGGLVTMLPAWALAGWLFVRFNRMQKALVAKTGGPAAARQAGARARNDRLSERKARRGKEPAAPAGPTPSKRYTPPKPTRSTPR